MQEDAIDMDQKRMEQAQKNHTTILRHLASTGQVRVAEILGLNESTVSRWKDGELEKIGKMLAALGLRVVDMNMRCYPADKLQAIFTLAKAHMDSMQSPEHLLFDDEPE